MKAGDARQDTPIFQLAPFGYAIGPLGLEYNFRHLSAAYHPGPYNSQCALIQIPFHAHSRHQVAHPALTEASPCESKTTR
ncbi:hypothetical protein PGT21_012477 [Puccinia graminis f. sp. tritici]|uniref:Uncharacterized protein n=1 Tax=Puccinia graminis f. sp. tritici TaxID=56615 RepID=A0A5B0M2B7_PUCGR|nr:hypothetical protein PGT21_012477 [Puccinia graminis f. sp. tritici]KAA1089952.1 hypothetical protein PGTUg99_031218 [Puccinia graminis f. sp. tritici]